jgi:hypothetical protein
MIRRLPCPGCGQQIPVPAGAKPGSLIECGNCAGVLFRLAAAAGREVLRMVQFVSCPACGERIPVNEGTPEGTIIRHRGTSLRLTRAFGAFALEPDGMEPPQCVPFIRGGPSDSAINGLSACTKLA